MHEELVTALQKRAVELPEKFSKNAENIDLFLKAADAIEELQERVAASEATIKRQSDIIKAKDRDLQRAINVKPQWIAFESRPMNDEEREYYSEMTGFDMSDDAVIYCSKLPEDGQEVLVCDKYGNVWQDIFCNDPEYGVGFETHGDMDGLVAWMPMPEPYKIEEGE